MVTVYELGCDILHEHFDEVSGPTMYELACEIPWCLGDERVDLVSQRV